MTAQEFALLLRSWDAPLGLLVWLDEYLAADPDATVTAIIAALPEEPVGKQGWYWWFDHALWWKLSMDARAEYQRHETPLYIDYLQVFDEGAYDRESQRVAFLRYKARMASVLAELMAGLHVPAVEVSA